MGTRTHPPQQSPRRCRHSDGAGRGCGCLTQVWGPLVRMGSCTLYLLSHFVSVSLSVCLYLSVFSLCLSTSSFLFLCLSIYLSVYRFTCLCVSLHFSPSLSLSVSLPFSSPPSGPTVPPRFVSKVRAVPFVEGEDTQVTCTIEGAPHPQIRWVRWTRGVGLPQGLHFCL